MKWIPIIAVNALPIAGAWMLTFMAVFAVVLFAIFPFILRRRRRREGAVLHARIEKARADILADGIVEGPKGPRAPHIPWGSKRRSPTNEAGGPKHNAYDGGPWA